MASKSKNINQYVDCRQLLDIANRDGYAQKLLRSKGSAIHFRQRIYQFRTLEMELLKHAYRSRIEDADKVGTSPFDKLRCRLVELDPPVEVGIERYTWAVDVVKEGDTPIRDIHGNIIESPQGPDLFEPEVKEEKDLLG